MKRERTPVMNLYEWSLTSWLSSDARNTLDATGRGIYRELLDLCYAQGRISADHSILARASACTVDIFEQYWPILKRYFRPVKNESLWLENAIANTQRRQYFAFVKEQQKRGRRGGKTRGKSKSRESDTSKAVASEKRSGGLSGGLSQQDKTRQNKTRQDKTAAMLHLDADDWSERLYSRHPKKKHKPLVERAVVELLGEGGQELLNEIDRVHVLWCQTPQWNEKAGWYAPKLDEWLVDHGWTAEPERMAERDEIPEWKTPEDELNHRD